MTRASHCFQSLLLSVFAGIFWNAPAHAATIVDTGAPGALLGIGNLPWGYGTQFTTSQSWTIDSVGTWSQTISDTGDSIIAALYSNETNDQGQGIPGDELFSVQIELPPFDPGVPIDELFVSAEGLDWGLAAGTYWIAFMGPCDTACSIGFVPIPGAFTSDGGDNWSPDNSAAAAVIEASAVPIPAALWLFGSGIAGLWSIRRTRPA